MATAQEVIDRVRRLINDEVSNFVAGVRWSDEELLQWLTDGQREIVQLKPEANPVTEVFDVEGGLPRQRLDPTVAYRLIRVEANGAGGPSAPAAEVVFQAEGVTFSEDYHMRGYDSDWLGSLVSTTFQDPYGIYSIFSWLIGGDTGVNIMLIGFESEEFPYSSVEIYAGEFDSLLLTLTPEDVSETYDDGVNQRTWVFADVGHVFAGDDEGGIIYSARFIP